MTVSKGKAAKFSLLRFVTALGLAVMAFGLDRSAPDLPRALFAAGTLCMCFFAGVFDPFSPTEPSMRLKGALEWAGFVSVLVGMALIAVSVALRVG